MTISLTIPCHCRDADLRAVLPAIQTAARHSPPVEIVVVDYANPAPLAIPWPAPEPGVTWRVIPVRRDPAVYHMAHARNVGIRAATGEVVAIGSADLRPAPDWFAVQRAELEAGAVWLEPSPQFLGFVTVRREILIALGGYDERFEFYGPEDKDLAARLARAGHPKTKYHSRAVGAIYTTDAEKVAHYRLRLSKRRMHLRGLAVLDDNTRRGATAVNVGLEWGQW